MCEIKIKTIKMILSEKQLRDSMPQIENINVVKYLPVHQKYLPIYHIDTPLRLTHFLAQVGHESLNFHYYKECASGAEYEGRKDLGNIHNGDGIKYKGRGEIQVTGEYNYKECSLALFNDTRLVDKPELLELPENSVQAACWFWTKNKLNDYADKDDIFQISKRINGINKSTGLPNGYKDRLQRLKLAKTAFGI